MRLQLLATLAAAFTLAGCESTTCEQKSSTYDWPSPSPSPSAPVEAEDNMPMSSTREDFMKSCQDRVYFDLNSVAVKKSDEELVSAIAEWLAKNESVPATIEGHCDERGTTEYNMALGDRRANTVKKHLVSKGVAADRLNTVSYGKEHPENAGHDESAWAQNRRAVVVVQ